MKVVFAHKALIPSKLKFVWLSGRLCENGLQRHSHPDSHWLVFHTAADSQVQVWVDTQAEHLDTAPLFQVVKMGYWTECLAP